MFEKDQSAKKGFIEIYSKYKSFENASSSRHFIINNGKLQNIVKLDTKWCLQHSQMLWVNKMTVIILSTLKMYLH